MNVEKIMADLEAKHPGESEYLQAVREVLESIEDEILYRTKSGTWFNQKSYLVQPLTKSCQTSKPRRSQ